MLVVESRKLCSSVFDGGRLVRKTRRFPVHGWVKEAPRLQERTRSMYLLLEKERKGES